MILIPVAVGALLLGAGDRTAVPGGVLLAAGLSCFEGCSAGQQSGGAALLILAGSAVVVTSIVDIVSAPGSARKYNVELGLVPVIRDGQLRPALALHVSF